MLSPFIKCSVLDNTGQKHCAYTLLGILLIPFAFLFIRIGRVTVKKCQDKLGCGTMRRIAAPLVGLLLSPRLFLGLEFALSLHGINVPLPAWWES